MALMMHLRILGMALLILNSVSSRAASKRICIEQMAAQKMDLNKMNFKDTVINLVALGDGLQISKLLATGECDAYGIYGSFSSRFDLPWTNLGHSKNPDFSELVYVIAGKVSEKSILDPKSTSVPITLVANKSERQFMNSIAIEIFRVQVEEQK